MKLTKKAFREYLNAQDKAEGSEHGAIVKPHHGPRGTRFQQAKRLYGDYLYAQDRVMFDVYYEEWKAENSHNS